MAAKDREGMSIAIKPRGDNRYAVLLDEQGIGFVDVHTNPYHSRNRYLTVQLTHYTLNESKRLFSLLQGALSAPLQVMVDSGNQPLVAFLMRGGFVRLRRCFEVCAKAERLVSGNPSEVALVRARAPERDYAACCQLMYQAYVHSHLPINPWTADETAFYSLLPKEVLYTKSGDAIENLAFVEENEIAYVCSTNQAAFPAFARALMEGLFRRHEVIYFEADDVDGTAMQLKGLFTLPDAGSHDTYVFFPPDTHTT